MALNAKETEEAIYQITRAVYNRLGEQADRKTVEALIGDIFDAIYPLIPESSTSQSRPEAATRFIVSVFGSDQPGIVASVAGLLAEARYSIIDINQTVVQGKFAMIMIVGASQDSREMAYLREEFRKLSQQLGVKIYFQREDLFHAMHRI
ncbi:MAG: ACT domain-containing protein [Candidatus Bathyarchaeia archaeon]